MNEDKAISSNPMIESCRGTFIPISWAELSAPRAISIAQSIAKLLPNKMMSTINFGSKNND